MSVTVFFMSLSDLRRRNRGAYSSPFSGVGVEFLPLGILPDHSGLVLHESGYLPRNDWWNFPNVLSPFWRLAYNFNRGHRMIFPGRTIELTPEHLALVPDHQMFHCQGAVPVRSFWMAFSVAWRLEPRQPIPILLRPTKAEKALLRELTGLFPENPRDADRPRIFHLSLALLHLVLRRPEIHWQRETSPVIAGSIRHIEGHYASALSVSHLAERANLCPDAFARAFKRHQGTTPARFIAQVRIREAANLLTGTDATLDAIAERCGFPNRAYFSRVFKKITGDSPAHFRRRHNPDTSV